MSALIRLLYNAVYPIVALIMLPGLIWKMLRRGKYRHKFGQRFAIYSTNVRSRLSDRPRTWVHAVSVGEVLIALKLIDRLRQREPDRAFVLSTTTSTGFALATQHRSDWLEPIYNPLDFILFTRRALALIRPVQLLLIEAEVWPNLVAGVRASGATTVLVNARLSPGSESRYRRARWITAPIFNGLDAICAPDPEDIARWQGLGVRRELLHVTGSIKFDNPAVPSDRDFRPLLDQLGIPADAPILLGASTHPGEERLLGETLLELRKNNPAWIYLCVPRHVERTPEILESLTALGLTTVLRTDINPRLDTSHPSPDVLVVNTTGELRDWYRCATIVVVGKSFLGKGGQNPAEAIQAGRPVLFGPNMQNFQVLVRDLVRNQGARQLASTNQLVPALSELLADSNARAALVENGQAVIARHLGATDRTCEKIESLPALNQ